MRFICFFSKNKPWKVDPWCLQILCNDSIGICSPWVCCLEFFVWHAGLPCDIFGYIVHFLLSGVDPCHWNSCEWWNQTTTSIGKRMIATRLRFCCTMGFKKNDSMSTWNSLLRNGCLGFAQLPASLSIQAKAAFAGALVSWRFWRSRFVRFFLFWL